MRLTIILPIYNEVESIPELMEKLFAATKQFPFSYEVIAVNDGSRDGSDKALDAEAAKRPELKVIHFRRNFGQTSAIHAGIEHASGEIIVPMDADLENDPADIIKLLNKLDEGYDVVSGWRKHRWADKKLVRKLPSVTANRLISYASGVPLHDYGCTLKAYRSEVVKGIPLYGEMHRFIPAYAAHTGARITEMEVNYQPRKYGKSKYGFSRTTRVILDMIVLRFLQKYMDRPIQFFGTIGILFGLVGVAAGIAAIGLRLFYGLHIVQTPLPTFSALGIIVGVQMITMGIIAEMVMRTYYESQDKRAYHVRSKVNF